MFILSKMSALWIAYASCANCSIEIVFSLQHLPIIRFVSGFNESTLSPIISTFPAHDLIFFFRQHTSVCYNGHLNSAFADIIY